MGGKIDIHHVQKELRRIDLVGHGEAQGIKMCAYSSDGTEIVLLAARKKDELVEELEGGGGWLMDACDDDQLCLISPVSRSSGENTDTVTLGNLLYE